MCILQIIYKQWYNKFRIIHMKKKPVLNDFDRTETIHMTIRRAMIVYYLGLVMDENVYWNAHVSL